MARIDAGEQFDRLPPGVAVQIIQRIERRGIVQFSGEDFSLLAEMDISTTTARIGR